MCFIILKKNGFFAPCWQPSSFIWYIHIKKWPPNRIKTQNIKTYLRNLFCSSSQSKWYVTWLIWRHNNNFHIFPWLACDFLGQDFQKRGNHEMQKVFHMKGKTKNLNISYMVSFCDCYILENQVQKLLLIIIDFYSPYK